MRLRVAEFPNHLKGALAPVYVISGDEPLQREEAADAVRAKARALGFTERVLLTVEAGFDWMSLSLFSNHRSLFGERRLIDLRMPSSKPGVPGAHALAAYVKHIPEEHILLLQCPRLERGSRWVEPLETAGVWLEVWPLKRHEIERWIQARLKTANLGADEDLIQTLATRAEGNLLAARQEIEKLDLLFAPGTHLKTQQALAVVTDSAHYSVFDLSEATLSKDPGRIVRVLATLKAEGESPPLVLWALTEPVRELSALAQTPSTARAGLLNRIKPLARRVLMQRALAGYTAVHWLGLLARCAAVDRIVKGQAPGNAWDELLQLALAIAGRAVFDIITEEEL